MFSSQLPDDELYRVYIHPYAEKHYVKRFAKDYKGKVWIVTLESIKDDLRRVRALEKGQQVDELRHGEHHWLFKYDFAIAKSGISPKKSGNRCIVFLDSQAHRVEILLVYRKDDVPKRVKETQWINSVMGDQFKEILGRFE